MNNDLKTEWRMLYSKTLPIFAKENNWPVYLDHCIARIIYDYVAGAKWDTVWKKPAIHNLDEGQLHACINTANKLIENELNPELLNQQSLQYRGKI